MGKIGGVGTETQVKSAKNGKKRHFCPISPNYAQLQPNYTQLQPTDTRKKRYILHHRVTQRTLFCGAKKGKMAPQAKKNWVQPVWYGISWCGQQPSSPKNAKNFFSKSAKVFFFFSKLRFSLSSTMVYKSLFPTKSGQGKSYLFP